MSSTTQVQKNINAKIVTKADRLFLVLMAVNFAKNKIKTTKILTA